jgi:hypothetical protein
MTPPSIARELDSPDPVGSALTRYRGRVYRFSDDPRHYVLAECLEERFLDDRPLQTATTGYVHACLTRIRETGRVPDFDPAIAVATSPIRVGDCSPTSTTPSCASTANEPE